VLQTFGEVCVYGSPATLRGLARYTLPIRADDVDGASKAQALQEPFAREQFNKLADFLNKS
jgi:hypothetical protein